MYGGTAAEHGTAFRTGRITGFCVAAAVTASVLYLILSLQNRAPEGVDFWVFPAFGITLALFVTALRRF